MRKALDQGREVLAVPGHPFDARASGCNMLIRDGGTLVRTAEDVIEPIGTPASPTKTNEIRVEPPDPTRSLVEMSALHGEILLRLEPSPVAEDQLIRDLRLPAREVAPERVNLELEGRIVRQSGGVVSLAN